jgi:DNA-binding protein HU-beta
MVKNAKKFSKADLIAKIATEQSITKIQAEKNLTVMLESIVELVSLGFDVKITGFGTFFKAIRKARIGVNPKTKERIKIPSYKTAGFKIGKTFKDIVKAAKEKK